MKSIIQNNRERCFICKKNGYNERLEEHHIFGGPYRKKSEKYGLKVYLCGSSCHRNGKKSAHGDPQGVGLRLRQIAQQVAMQEYGWTVDKFIEEFGRNYL